ncbi:MAG TPA: rod shape-determining protein RodA [Wenzhouxiangellaceae bacterium]|nr:rod shape-determining protein RodA [Wenzhouxiangellaceae bacterium]
MNLDWLIREFRHQPFRLDPLLCGLLLLLMLIGLMVLYSASDADLGTVWRQAVRLGLGVVLLVVASQITPAWYRRWAPWLYAIGVALLVAVVFFGVGRGAARWLDLGVIRFQPSEMMKIGVPLMLAAWLHKKPLPPRLADFVICALLIAVPTLLIASQPDLGTSLLVAVGGGMVLFLSGVRWRWIAAGGAAAVAAAPLLWNVLHDYQRNRVLTFLDPESDPLGQGWNIIQSKIAVGTGGLTGRGWLDSTQSRLEFLPEPHTDFILSVIAEEFGFIGVAALFVLYAAIVLRAIFLASQARDPFGRMLGASLVFLFFVYLLVNAGMISGVMPVVGVPLPLVSYGGTSAATLLAGFGIIMSFYSRRKMLKS